MTEQIATNRTVIGKVVSDKMNCTIVVEVERTVKHAVYGKFLRRSSKMYAHDAENTCKMGDIVLIQQSRPLSKTKHWILLKVLERSKKAENE
jgi:small subunit ribosomal protein S17